MSDPVEKNPSDEAEEKRQRNKRNLALALMIVAFVVTVYFVTILRLGASVADRSF